MHAALQTLQSTLHSTLALHTLHLTPYTSHSALYTLHSTLYTLHFTLHTLRFTLRTSQFTLHTLHFTLYTSHSTLHALTLHSAVYTLHSTPYSLHWTRTLHFTLYTSHFTLYTSHSTLCTLNSTLCTLHSTLHIPQSPFHTRHTRFLTQHAMLRSLHWYGNRGKRYKTVEITCFTKVFYVTAFGFVGWFCFFPCTGFLHLYQIYQLFIVYCWLAGIRSQCRPLAGNCMILTGGSAPIRPCRSRFIFSCRVHSCAAQPKSLSVLQMSFSISNGTWMHELDVKHYVCNII